MERDERVDREEDVKISLNRLTDNKTGKFTYRFTFYYKNDIGWTSVRIRSSYYTRKALPVSYFFLSKYATLKIEGRSPKFMKDLRNVVLLNTLIPDVDKILGAMISLTEDNTPVFLRILKKTMNDIGMLSLKVISVPEVRNLNELINKLEEKIIKEN